jgi:flagellar FliJ protein
MRSFKFRLEEFLRIRRHIERNCELKLAKITGRCVLLEGRLRELGEEKVRHGACSVEGILYSITELHARGAYLKRIDHELKETHEELVKRRKEQEKANREYLEAAKNRKVLDKLKERKAAEYYKEQLLDDIKALDEIGANIKIRSAGQENRREDKG